MRQEVTNKYVLLMLALSSTALFYSSHALYVQNYKVRPEIKYHSKVSSSQYKSKAFLISPLKIPYAKLPNSLSSLKAEIASKGLYVNGSNMSLDEDTNDELIKLKREILDDFSPKTPTILQSIVFFARYVIKSAQLKRNKKRKKKEFRRKYRLTRRQSGVNSDVINGDISDDDSYFEPPKSIREHLASLNKSRKQIIHLVGYGKSIIVPSFTFLILGALFTSIVPHYYSNSITSLASAIALEKTSADRAVGTATLFHNLFGLGIFSTLMAITTGARGSLFWIAGARGNYNVRTKFHRTLLRQEAAFFDGTETGILLSRLNNDVNKIGMVVSFHVNIVLRQISQFLFGSIYLYRTSPSLSLFAFLGISVIAYISKIYGDFARTLAEQVQDQLADGSAVAETSFTMSETIRAFDGLDIETARYEEAQKKALDLEEVQAWAYGTHKFITDVLQTGMQIALLVACWTYGQKGFLDAAKLTSFLFYVNFVLESSNEVGDQWAKIQSAIGASSSVFALIRRIPKIMDPIPSAVQSKHTISADANIKDIDYGEIQNKPIIDMTNMTVKYDEMDSTSPALQNINLQIFQDDKIAIVGRSGSGKSSMLRTVLRFYDPSSGGCFLDGRLLKEYTRKDLAKKVVNVEQEPHLFPMTLLENILYGIEIDGVKQSSDEICTEFEGTDVGYNQTMRERVIEALEMAGLPVGEKDNNDLGLTLDTRVGEGGRTLSGGQRQRVAIARALVRKPDVLLLDEPT